MPRASPPGPVERELREAALKHAWDWFALHAQQRMQTVNFFIALEGGLVAGAGYAFKEDAPGLLLVLGLLITLMAVLFMLVEERVKFLIKLSENVLCEEQAYLGRVCATANMEFVRQSDVAAPKMPTYGKIFRVMFIAFIVLGLGIAVLAATKIANTPVGVSGHSLEVTVHSTGV